MNKIVKDDSVNAEIVDPLAALAADANRWHEQAETAAQSFVEAAWYCGQALLQAKQLLKHGEWKPWLQENFRGSYRTAATYMQMAGKVQSPALLENSVDAT